MLERSLIPCHFKDKKMGGEGKNTFLFRIENERKEKICDINSKILISSPF